MTGGRSDVGVAGYILAGGGSRRFGRDKALAEVGGRPMLVRMIELLQSVTRPVKIVGVPGKYAAFGAEIVEDRLPGEGPLGKRSSTIFAPNAAYLPGTPTIRSEEHTSELQSRSDLVCRLLLLKKKLFRSDRTSTRLNSSHDQISYDVFCLKKDTAMNAPDPYQCNK